MQTQTPVTLPTRTPKPTCTTVPTRTVTPTPWPTLQPELAELVITDLMQNNGNCERPCVWGIYPNESSFYATVAYLSTIMPHHSIWGSFYSAGYEYKNTMRICLEITKYNDLVGGIVAGVDGLNDPMVSSEDWLAFRPDSIMRDYGMPSRVEFYISNAPYVMGSYGYTIIPDQLQTAITYDGASGTTFPVTWNVCLLKEHEIRSFDLWLGEISKIPHYGKDVSMITSLSVADFYNLLLTETGTACINLHQEAVK